MTPAESELARYSPWLRYDSHESFRADSAATLTDSVAATGPNALKRTDGTVLARAGAGLSLGLLGRQTYSDGRPVKRDDLLDETGRDYVGDARRMHAKPGYADRAYGRVAIDRQSARWLQYWLFYYYNDKQFLGIGLHEGDWEMIQIRLTATGAPDAVTYAQHGDGERAAWTGVEKAADGAPIVYVARGSHASLLRRGRHAAPIVPDDCDAKGPLIRPALEPLTAAWPGWPGSWGSTRSSLPGESPSPRGPVEHSQWRDPLAFHEQAKDARQALAQSLAMAAAPAPSPPELTARAEGGHAVVRWRVDAETTRLVLSLDSPRDDLPPATYHVVADGEGVGGSHAGVVEPREGVEPLPPELEPGFAYVVRGRAVNQHHLAGADTLVPVEGT